MAGGPHASWRRGAYALLTMAKHYAKGELDPKISPARRQLN